MRKRDQRIVLLMLASLIVLLTSQAQNQSSDSTSLREGVWALQFGISGNFTLTSFQGSTLAAKYQLSERNAIRGGVTITGSMIDGNGSYTGTVADTGIGNAPGNTSTRSANVSFVLQYLWYVNPNGPVHLFAGLGPSLSYSYSNSSSEYSYLYTGAPAHWVTNKGASSSILWAPGLSGVVGIEWFASRWLSLHAEYSEGLQYQWRSTTSTYDFLSTSLADNPYHTENPITTKGLSLSSSSVSFGLNVYW
jgi:hypothetical protein